MGWVGFGILLPEPNPTRYQKKFCNPKVQKNIWVSQVGSGQDNFVGLAAHPLLLLCVK